MDVVSKEEFTDGLSKKKTLQNVEQLIQFISLQRQENGCVQFEFVDARDEIQQIILTPMISDLLLKLAASGCGFTLFPVKMSLP